ncbi:MAG: hypothetical protein K2W96_15170 [Gemmataceae bacterium]|nr:hypothetical protein [Gemmataceae bacterium]
MLALLLLFAEGRYVVPKPGDPFDHAPPRLLPMSDAPPPGLKVTAKFKGKRQRWGRLEYGLGKTAGVVLVADEVAPGKIDLYADLLRDNAITPDSLLKEWRVEIDAHVPKGDTVAKHPRTVLFRWGKITRTLAVATCGYIEAEARLDGKKLRVRRIDGDANGLFSDAQDRLVIGDEELPFAPIVRLGEQRVIVRADALGKQLSLAPLTGTGTVKLVTKLKAEEAMVTLQSKDGIVATIRQADGSATLPPGEYRISSVLLTLAAKDGPAWGYVFGDNGGREKRWHKLEKGGTITLDPVGKLDFLAHVERSGENANVQLRLYTAEGLLIEKAYRGSFDGYGTGAGIEAKDGGRSLGRTSTGFA